MRTLVLWKQIAEKRETSELLKDYLTSAERQNGLPKMLE